MRAVLGAVPETFGTEHLQARGEALYIVGPDIQVHPVLDLLRLGDSLQQQGWIRKLLRTKQEVRLEEADLVVTKCLRPEIGESFGIFAVDNEIDARLQSHLLSGAPRSLTHRGSATEIAFAVAVMVRSSFEQPKPKNRMRMRQEPADGRPNVTRPGVEFRLDEPLEP